MKKPKKISIILTLIVAFIAYFGSLTSPMLGYIFSILFLIMLVVAMSTKSIWPTNTKTENPYFFSAFWGLIFGLIIPFVLDIFIKEGFKGLYDIITG